MTVQDRVSLTFEHALDASPETQKLVAQLAESPSRAVRELWRELRQRRVDVSEAEALGGGDEVARGLARTALAVAQVLHVGLSVRSLVDLATRTFRRGGTPDEARRAVLDALARSGSADVASLASELREERQHGDVR